MEQKVFQACFTRVGASCIEDVVSDNIVSEGYQSIHCSPDMPPEVRDVFESRRKTVQPAGGKYVKSWGLSLFCQRNICGIEGLQFDLLSEDRSGGARPCFFDQTFLMQDAYELLKEPENLVYFSEDNFGINFEKASAADRAAFQTSTEGRLKWCIRNTAAIPDALKVDKPTPENLTADAICRKYGMTKDHLMIFIKSVYHQLFFSDIPMSIFVKTDGTVEMMKDLLYLLMSMIPYSSRVRISAGQYCFENQKGNNIFFTEQIPSRQGFADPLTGETNVLDDSNSKRFDERFPYISLALSLDDDRRKKYFDMLADTLEKLGMGRAYDWKRQHLNLAHMLITGRYDKDNLVPILYGLLKYPVSHNRLWEKQMTDALKSVIENKVKLSGEMEQMLFDTALENSEGSFYGTLMSYEASLLEDKDVEEAVSALEALGADKVKFVEIRNSLMQTEKGQALLHEYYLRRIIALKQSKADIDFAALANSVRGIKNNEDLLALLADHALEKTFRDLCDKKKSLGEARRDLEKTFAEIYKEQNRKPGEIGKRLNDLYDQYLMSNISAQLLKNGDFREFYGTYGREYPDGAGFLKALNALKEGDYEAAEKYLDSKLPQKYENKICRFIASRMSDSRKKEGFIPLSLWLKVSQKSNNKPAELMVGNKAKIIYDSRLLDNDLDEEKEQWTDALIRETMDAIKVKMKEEPKTKKALRDSLEIFKVEMEMRKKGKKGFFSKLFGN